MARSRRHSPAPFNHQESLEYGIQRTLWMLAVWILTIDIQALAVCAVRTDPFPCGKFLPSPVCSEPSIARTVSGAEAADSAYLLGNIWLFVEALPGCRRRLRIARVLEPADGGPVEDCPEAPDVVSVGVADGRGVGRGDPAG